MVTRPEELFPDGADGDPASFEPPTSAESWNDLGCRAYRLAEFDYAVGCFLRALELDPQGYRPLFNLGLAYIELERSDEAIRTLRHALDLRPDYAPGWLHLGTVYEEVERDGREALESYSRGLTYDSSHAELLFRRGSLLVDLGRTAEAIDDLRRASRLSRSDERVWATLGYAYLQGDHADEAVEALRNSVALAPEVSEFWFNLGNAILAQGDADEGARCFRRVVEIDPEDADAWNNLGSAQVQLEEIDDARASFAAAVEIQADCHLGWSNLGAVHMRLGSYQEAERCFTRAIESAVDDPSYYVHRALARLAVDDQEGVRADLDRAAVLDPSCALLADELVASR